MQTPFRNDVDALKNRLTSLDEEIASLRAKAREYDDVKERLSRMEGEQEDVRREIDARATRRATPFLDTLRIASPCRESWDEMIGDERTRFCGKCQKDVHNVSEMTRDEAEAFLESVASSVCVRMYKRVDGTLITADCPVGVKRKRIKRLFLATIGGGLAAAAGAVAFWRIEEHVTMGDISPTPTAQVMGAMVEDPSARYATPPPPTQEPVHVTGGVRPMPEKQHPVMGKPTATHPAVKTVPASPSRTGL